MIVRHLRAGRGEGPRTRFPIPFLCVLLALPAAGAAVAAPPLSRGTREAGRLDSSLKQVVKQADRQVRAPAGRQARELPAETQRLQALREPAGTVGAQVKIALDELRQMSFPGTLDPHYAPALVAAGRAYVAVSGKDLLTGATINPEYAGLASELAASEASEASSAKVAARLAAATRGLSRALARERRRSHRLVRLLRREAPTRPGR